MAENGVVVASAVVLPDTTEDDQSPTTALKRRQSSVSPGQAKRQRVADTDDAPATREEPQVEPKNDNAKQRMSREVDERKRGKRLFGALLGTLAQNSSSTAQKRRNDIEKKQQEKLKLQAEEDDEKKKQKLDALMDERRHEQVVYDEQTRLLKQSNLLAAAHFLQTKTQPVLYYKPWELLPDEKTQIESQISKAQGTTEKEKGTPGRIADAPEGHDSKSPQIARSPEHGLQDSEAMGKAADSTEHSTETVDTNEKTRPDETKAHASSSMEENLQESSKDAIDEGGDDMVEGEEDAVIY